MLVIDRFEDGYAVCECDEEQFVHIRKSLIGEDVREGDVLVWTNAAFDADAQQTAERRQRIRRKLDSLFSKNTPT